MCGISGIAGKGWERHQLEAMVQAQRHRGPDGEGVYINPDNSVGLGHNRLSIIDLSGYGSQPMSGETENIQIVFNGEIYNYIELKKELKDSYHFKSGSDTEVIIAAYKKWGTACLDKFIGMFAFAIWDERKKELFAARDRFGVKPFHYCYKNGVFVFASEIKAIKAAGIKTEANMAIWSAYFANGLYDHNEETFWKDIYKLPAGHCLTYKDNAALSIKQWYDLADALNDVDERSDAAVEEELLSLLEDTVRLRFRADVPVGVCLSGGVDSSLLHTLIQRVKGTDFPVHAFTFYTGYEQYDELPWAEKITQGTKAITHACGLFIDDVPQLAKRIAYYMDEPYGGIPTLGMSQVFKCAQQNGIKVLLDGNGIDEAWGGYDYYRNADAVNINKGPVQGSGKVISLEDCMKNAPEKAGLSLPQNTKDKISLLQYRDIKYTKIPRAMRFADRNAMAYSTELREPFLDHRIVALGLKQPQNRKVRDGVGKWMVRNLASKIIPKTVSEAPKRAVQTPQREWLGNELSVWADEQIHNALSSEVGALFNNDCIEAIWGDYKKNMPDNSFYIWQLINTGLLEG